MQGENANPKGIQNSDNVKSQINFFPEVF